MKFYSVYKLSALLMYHECFLSTNKLRSCLQGKKNAYNLDITKTNVQQLNKKILLDSNVNVLTSSQDKFNGKLTEFFLINTSGIIIFGDFFQLGYTGNMRNCYI